MLFELMTFGLIIHTSYSRSAIHQFLLEMQILMEIYKVFILHLTFLS